MKKLMPEDLDNIRQSMQTKLNLTASSCRAKITVHMGTCGVAAGAQEIWDAMTEALAESKKQDIMLTSSGCAGLCNHEPMMTVQIKGSPPVKYVKLNRQKAERIFSEHVLNGDIVVEDAFCIGSERTY